MRGLIAIIGERFTAGCLPAVKLAPRIFGFMS